MPSSGNRHLPARRRAVYSSPGAYPPVQETGDFSPENYLFSPAEVYISVSGFLHYRNLVSFPTHVPHERVGFGDKIMPTKQSLSS